jgi:hypothetical protein
MNRRYRTKKKQALAKLARQPEAPATPAPLGRSGPLSLEDSVLLVIGSCIATVSLFLLLMGLYQFFKPLG